MLGKLERERRAVQVRIAGEERWIAAEDAGLYRDALGVPPPGGLPDVVPRGRSTTRWLALVRRYARTHGPFPTGADRAPLRGRPDPGAARARARRRARPRRAAPRRHASASGATPTSCAASAAPASPRLRQEVEAVDPAELARFLPAWQNVDAHRPAGAGPDRLREALVPLQGVALTPEVWERDVLPRRLGAYSPTWLDQLTHQRRARLDRRRAARPRDRQGRALLPRGRPPRRPAAVEREARPAPGRGPRRDPRAARRRALVLARPGRRARRSSARSSTRRSGISSGPARSPTTPSRRCAPGG